MAYETLPDATVVKRLKSLSAKSAEADVDAAIRGATTEQVLRHVANGTAYVVIAGLVRRFDAKAARRARKAETAAESAETE